MNKFVRALLLVGEAVLAVIVARPAILNAIKIAHTRKEIFEANLPYFMGMLWGDAFRCMIAALLAGHFAWLARKWPSK